MYTYDQRSGLLLNRNGEEVGIGYSGRGAGKNNPAFQNVKNVGPITRGVYKIGPAFDDAKLGPAVMYLMPYNPLRNGRGGFMIHGDNALHDASEGCIILGKAIRARIMLEDDSLLEVV